MQIISISNKAESQYFTLKKIFSKVKSMFIGILVDALNHFKGKTNEEIKKTAFETAMLGMQGINTDKKDYIISSVSNKRYTGNQVLAYYYTAWALTIPEQLQNLGLDFEKEYELAKKIIFKNE